MTEIGMIEQHLKDTFKVLNGYPHYIGIEEKEGTDYEPDIWQDKIGTLIEFATQCELNRLSALINRSSDHYRNLSKMLTTFGFEKFASKVEVYRELQDIKDDTGDYEWRSLSNSTISEDEFKHIWKKCMLDSGNSPSSLTMDEHLSSVKKVLGINWRDSCIAIYTSDQPIGVSIPHIEPGTQSEGRLFYFGLVPEERGKGQSTLIHYQSMNLLKQMGAKYYIGSTHETNFKMQNVFSRNGCFIRAKTESYYKYLDS